jgi:hypothetical protein
VESIKDTINLPSYIYVINNLQKWTDALGYDYYDYNSSKASVLKGIKNDDWFIFAGHGYKTHEYISTLDWLFGNDPIVYPAAIGPENESWKISMYDKDFVDAIKYRKESGKSLKMSIFFACESVEMAQVLGKVSDVSVGFSNEEISGTLWGFANLFAAAIKEGKSIDAAITEGNKIAVNQMAAVMYRNALQTISDAIYKPIVNNISTYVPSTYFLDPKVNCSSPTNKD